MRLLVSTLIATTLLGSTAFAQVAATGSEHCRALITEAERYQSGFGEVTLQGDPLELEYTYADGTPTGVSWRVPHDTIVVEFPDQTLELNRSNVHPSALADYIGTTVSAMEQAPGNVPFFVISDEVDGNRLGLIQPFGSEAKGYGCYGSVVPMQ